MKVYCQHCEEPIFVLVTDEPVEHGMGQFSERLHFDYDGDCESCEILSERIQENEDNPSKLKQLAYKFIQEVGDQNLEDLPGGN